MDVLKDDSIFECSIQIERKTQTLKVFTTLAQRDEAIQCHHISTSCVSNSNVHSNTQNDMVHRAFSGIVAY